MQVYFGGLICADASWYNCYAIVQALRIARVHYILVIYLTRPQWKLLAIWKFLHARKDRHLNSVPGTLAFAI